MNIKRNNQFFLFDPKFNKNLSKVEKWSSGVSGVHFKKSHMRASKF